eukprot:2409400-Prymnesium_polylepis.2
MERPAPVGEACAARRRPAISGFRLHSLGLGDSVPVRCIGLCDWPSSVPIGSGRKGCGSHRSLGGR